MMTCILMMMRQYPITMIQKAMTSVSIKAKMSPLRQEKMIEDSIITNLLMDNQKYRKKTKIDLMTQIK